MSVTPDQLKRAVWINAVIIVVLMLVTIILYVYATQNNTDPGVEQSHLAQQGLAPHFELTTADGETYHTDTDTIKLLMFFLIHCPDGTCPLTMSDFTVLQERLKEAELFGTEVELLAVTVDPHRDDFESLQQYAQMFNVDSDGWKVLRGEVEEIDRITDDLNYMYEVDHDAAENHNGHDGNEDANQNNAEEAHAAVHMTTMYLIDRNHYVRNYYRMSTTEERMDLEQIQADMEQLVAESNES